MIPDLINKLYETGLISKKHLDSLFPLKKDYDKKLGLFLVDGGFLSKNELSNFTKENQDFLFKLFDKWLNENSKLANAIIWRVNESKEYPNGMPAPYNVWSELKRKELSKIFWNTLMDILPGLNEAPNISVNLSDDGNVYSTDLVPQDAWTYYLTYVAHGLRVEIDRLVHWSILRYNQSQLEFLFDSRTFFEYFESRDVYSIIRWDESLFSHGSVTMGDPVRIYDFLDNEKLIGMTRWGSIGRFLGWCRDELTHYEDGNTSENYQKHWQYDGYPPIERIISGTNHPDMGFKHYTAGCFGTTGFLRYILKTINIPVLLVERCGHAMPHFVYDVSHDFYLSHGDDPYNNLYKHNTPKFIPLELIIDHYKFDEWFNTNLPKKTICNNIGRRALELAVEYIPNEILKIYCDDISKDKKPEEGRMYNEIFRDHISIYELKALGFWDRLKNRTESLGGCTHILDSK
jgi:hypothetical protein